MKTVEQQHFKAEKIPTFVCNPSKTDRQDVLLKRGEHVPSYGKRAYPCLLISISLTYISLAPIFKSNNTISDTKHKRLPKQGVLKAEKK